MFLLIFNVARPNKRKAMHLKKKKRKRHDFTIVLAHLAHIQMAKLDPLVGQFWPSTLMFDTPVAQGI